MVLVVAAMMGAPMLAGGVAVNRRAEAGADARPEADGDGEDTDDQPDDQGALDERENLKTLPDQGGMPRFLVKREAAAQAAGGELSGAASRPRPQAGQATAEGVPIR